MKLFNHKNRIKELPRTMRDLTKRVFIACLAQSDKINQCFPGFFFIICLAGNYNAEAVLLENFQLVIVQNRPVKIFSVKNAMMPYHNLCITAGGQINGALGKNEFQAASEMVKTAAPAQTSDDQIQNNCKWRTQFAELNNNIDKLNHHLTRYFIPVAFFLFIIPLIIAAALYYDRRERKNFRDNLLRNNDNSKPGEKKQ